MEETVTRPEGCTTEHLEYLDRLRASGRTNMFGAASYLQSERGMAENEAHATLKYWMVTFGLDDR